VSPLHTLLEATTAPRSSEVQLLDLDGTALIMLGIFLILMLILWGFLWKPYLRIRDERVARVEGAREQANKLEADATNRLARIESELADARRAGQSELAKMRQLAQIREQQITGEAQENSRQLLQDARAKLDAALAVERANWQQHTSALARELAEKSLGRRISS
jgi:F-type H+-transporting ATPase subunit b